jgi:hypothetical protein
MKTSRGDFLRISSVVIAAVGGLMIVIAVAADWLLAGSWAGFGLKQAALALAGLLLLLAGLALRTRVGREWAYKLPGSPLLLVSFGILMGLLAVEGGLRLVQRINPDQQAISTVYGQDEIQALYQPISDPKLGVRMAPHAGGHDAKGWRNDAVPDRVEIVAIGDSQTWGVNVDRYHAWPQTLSKISGRTVYNMALGYYGTVEYWVLVDEAMELSPEIIVVGLYFGNDLEGAYRTVYGNDTYARFRSRESGSEEMEDMIGPLANALYQEREDFRREKLQAQWLARNSALVQLLQVRGIWPSSSPFQLDKAWAMTYPHHGAVYEQNGIRTVFTTAYRLLALDLDNPQISEGLRITEEMLLRIQAQAGQANIRVLVLLIPTKELVYADAMQGAGLDETYSRLVVMEEKARSEIIRYCEEHGIEQVDALPVLRAAVLRGEQIYPESADGHPVERGYFLLASAVHDALSK